MPYTEAMRARMVRRMVGPGASSVTALSEEMRIPLSTLCRWRRAAASIQHVTLKPEAPAVEPSTASKRPQDWDPAERAQLVLDARGLSELALGELLRSRGVHREHLDEWRAQLATAFNLPTSRRSGEAKQIRALERELARKDKALAETTALLVLQKKLHLLFPTADEDDDTDPKSEK